MKVNIEGITINYEILNREYFSGDNPVLVFLHDGLGSIKQWKDFPKYLAAKLKFPALLYDRYGYGESSELNEARSPDFHFQEAGFLKKLLEKLHINQPVVLFGHSDGGTIALVFAYLFPEIVKAVISEAHHIKIEDITIKGMKEALSEYENGLLREKLYKYHGDKVDSLFYAWVKTGLSDNFANLDLEFILPEIKAPILAIQGKQDQYGSEYQLNIIREKNKNPLNEYLYIDGCKHFPHFEKTGLILETVQNFLQKVLKENF